MKMPTSHGVAHPQVLSDCTNLGASKLREKYASSYCSWRNMKSRRAKGAIIAPEFETFAGFLASVGPRPTKDFTLDRLDNANPEYAPNTVAWRSIAAQNNNKGNTVFLTDSDGAIKPLRQWAATLSISANTLYSRRQLGWSDVEVLHGKKEPPPESLTALLARTPWPEDKRLDWEREFQLQLLTTTEPCNDRRDFLVSKLKLIVETNRQRLESLAFDLPPDDYWRDSATETLEAEIKGLQFRYEQDNALLLKVERELFQERKREEFALRRCGLGRSAERQLFDLVSGNNNA